MSLNKKKMVREIGRRTRIRNRDVQAVIEALIDVWTEELVGGGRIELENFVVIKAKSLRSREQELNLTRAFTSSPLFMKISVVWSRSFVSRLRGKLY